MQDRKIGETFSDGENKIKVIYGGCDQCHYYKPPFGCKADYSITGECLSTKRTGKKPVAFRKI